MQAYGWYYSAVLCTLAHLCARGKVECAGGRHLPGDGELESALRTPTARQCGAGAAEEFTASQVRALK
jgi:hypothetical protein